MKKAFEALDVDEQSLVKDQYTKAIELKDKESSQIDETEKMLDDMLAKRDAKISETLKADIKKEISEYIKEQKELIEKKAGVYAKDIKTDRKKISTYMRNLCGAIVKGGDFEVKLKEMTTDDTGSPFAGYTVDSELAAEIRHLMTEYGIARREFETVQLSKNTYKANELITDIVTYWTDEGSAILSSQVVLGQNTLELKKLTAIVSMTSELLEDTEIDFVGFVGKRVAESFANAEDSQFFNGDGTTFTGLLQSANVNTVTMTGTTFASIDADDLIAMVDATPQGALSNGKYYMHRSIMSFVRQLKDSQNAYIFQKPSESGPGTIWGYPVVQVEAMPSSGDTAAATAFVIFGDLKKGALLGFKGAIKVKRFDAGIVRNVANDADINLITTDREAVRWVSRVGYMQTITTLKIPITVLKTAAASA